MTEVRSWLDIARLQEQERGGQSLDGAESYAVVMSQDLITKSVSPEITVSVAVA